MANIPLCFDKFVISTKNLKSLHKNNNLNQVPSCENKRNRVAMSRDTLNEFDGVIGSDEQTVNVEVGGGYGNKTIKNLKCRPGVHTGTQSRANSITENCEARNKCVFELDNDCNVRVKFHDRCRSNRNNYNWSNYDTSVQMSGCTAKVIKNPPDDDSVKFTIKHHCVDENLKCNSATQNIYNQNDLYFYLDEKTKMDDTRERKNYSDLIGELIGFFSIINDSDSRNKWNAKGTGDKEEWNKNLRHLLREILSLENDNELLDKKLQQLYNTSSTTGNLYSKFINEFQKENKKSEDLGENEGEDLMRRDESYKNSTSVGYNNLFYTILVIVSALFLKSQLK